MEDIYKSIVSSVEKDTTTHKKFFKKGFPAQKIPAPTGQKRYPHRPRKKLFLKKAGKKTSRTRRTAGLGGCGGIIYVKILLKKSVCLVLALGWRENINKKKYMGDGVKCCFRLVLLLVVVL